MPHRYTEIPNWFVRREVDDNVFHVYEPYYRNDFRCNIYVIRGSKDAITLDSGLGLSPLKDFLNDIVQDPLLVSSHGHYDHIGGNFEFRRRLIHPAEAGIVTAPNHENTYARELLATNDFYQSPWRNFDAAEWVVEPAPPTGLIDEGDVIDLGSRRFTVLHTPGHSWGGICLWDVEDHALFCADTVYSGELFDSLSCSDIPAYVQSMERLLEFPVRVAFPGHGPILTGEQFKFTIRAYLSGKV